MFDEAHKLYSETDNDNVPSEGATERSVMMHNTATLKSTYSLESAVYADDENEVPPEEHDDYNQAKKIAPLDALFPKIQVPSNDKNMHESTQEEEKNPAVKAAKTTLYAKSKLAINMRALTLKTYKEDGSRAETVTTIMMHNTDTLKSDDEKEEPPGNHDGPSQAAQGHDQD
jgi:hypothetical protein